MKNNVKVFSFVVSTFFGSTSLVQAEQYQLINLPALDIVISDYSCNKEKFSILASSKSPHVYAYPEAIQRVSDYIGWLADMNMLFERAGFGCAVRKYDVIYFLGEEQIAKSNTVDLGEKTSPPLDTLAKYGVGYDPSSILSYYYTSLAKSDNVDKFDYSAITSEIENAEESDLDAAIIGVTHHGYGNILLEPSESRPVSSDIEKKYRAICKSGYGYYCLKPNLNSDANLMIAIEEFVEYGTPISSGALNEFQKIREAAEFGVLYAKGRMRIIEEDYPEYVSSLKEGGEFKNSTEVNPVIIGYAINGWFGAQCRQSVEAAEALANLNGVEVKFSSVFSPSSDGCSTGVAEVGSTNSGIKEVKNLNCEVSSTEFARCNFELLYGLTFSYGQGSVDDLLSEAFTKRAAAEAELVYLPNQGWKLVGLRLAN